VTTRPEAAAVRTDDRDHVFTSDAIVDYSG
jgi:hypothetical protein